MSKKRIVFVPMPKWEEMDFSSVATDCGWKVTVTVPLDPRTFIMCESDGGQKPPA